jgi:ATP-dependent Clp protease ATP-binding subunit ClpA
VVLEKVRNPPQSSNKDEAIIAAVEIIPTLHYKPILPVKAIDLMDEAASKESEIKKLLSRRLDVWIEK